MRIDNTDIGLVIDSGDDIPLILDLTVDLSVIKYEMFLILFFVMTHLF